MSHWYMPEREHIDLSDDGKEVDVWLGSNDAGSIWCAIKVEHLLEVLKELLAKKV